MTPRALLALTLLCLSLASSLAGPNEDWTSITSLDSGPKGRPTSAAEARSLARAHLVKQRDSLQAFLLKYPRDPRAMDARKRLAATWAALGKMDDNPAQVDKALSLLSEIESSGSASREEKASAAFLRASIEMQNQSGDPEAVRTAVVRIAQDFCARYPGDRRSPRLLVEAATLCDNQPSQKQALLEQALRDTTEEGLKQRIRDDFKRLSQIGKPLQLRFTSVTGGQVDLAALKGQVVIVIFWASDSPHSLLWLRDFQSTFGRNPPPGVRIVTISLDRERHSMATRLRELPDSWPAYFDGKGWEGPVPRTLGINALPSVWIIDKKGIVRTINAKSDYADWVRRLLAE